MKKIIITLLTTLMFIFPGLTANAATLNVAHTSALSWQASYDITTKGNKITKVSHIKVHSYTGRITSKKIIRSGNNKVTLRMTKQIGTIRYIVKLTATLKNKKVIVSTT